MELEVCNLFVLKKLGLSCCVLPLKTKSIHSCSSFSTLKLFRETSKSLGSKMEWWHLPIVPATQEDEVGGSLEPTNLKPAYTTQWDQSQKKNKKTNKKTLSAVFSALTLWNPVETSLGPIPHSLCPLLLCHDEHGTLPQTGLPIKFLGFVEFSEDSAFLYLKCKTQGDWRDLSSSSGLRYHIHPSFIHSGYLYATSTFLYLKGTNYLFLWYLELFVYDHDIDNPLNMFFVI